MANENVFERARSPRAPKYSLPQSLTYARSIYDAVHRSAVNSAMAYELMGFAGKSGSSATALGSVRQFGLVEGIGEKTKITDLALSIFEPSSSFERSRAIREASSRPEIFRALRDRFNGRIPGADEPIRAFLIRDMGFSKGGADETMRSLRETEQYVLAEHVEIIPERENATEPVQENVSTAPSALISSEHYSESPAERVTETVRVALAKDCYAELRFYGELTDRAVGNLIRYIELMKEVWTEN